MSSHLTSVDLFDGYTTPEAQACGGGGEGGSCDSWLANSSAQAAWQSVQNIRAQLRSCLEQSAALPPIPPFNPVCTYTTFSGYFQLGGAAELQKLEANPDMQVSVEYNHSCYDPKNLSSLPAITSGLVTISGYSCH